MTHTPPGRMVEVDGVPMHVIVEGSGAPTVVLESGLGGTALEWEAVACSLRAETTVVRRDRPGLGWSPRADRPRDGESVARELRSTLAAADVGGPFVLVGHSLGGLYVRAFAALHPDEVCGVVLVDATPEALFADLPGLRRARTVYAAVLRGLARTGPVGTQLLHRMEPRAMLAQLRPEAHARHLPQFAMLRDLDDGHRLPALAAEQSSVPTTCAQLDGTALPAVPLVVLSRGRASGNARADAVLARMQAAHASQAATLTPDGAHRVVPDSGHLMHLERPDAIVEAVRDVQRRWAST